MSGGPETVPISDVVRLTDVSVKAAAAYGRPDLGRRLSALKDLLANPGTNVAVCGEFKQGKSTLVNALVGTPLCPVDDDVATAVPTYIGWGEQPRAQVIGIADHDGTAVAATSIGLDDIAFYIVEQPGTYAPRPERVRILVPNDILREGLVLVDTPGVGGLTSAHGTATLSTLPFAEALLFVSDASQEYTEAELAFLRRAVSLCPKVLCLLTKIDLHSQWRRILDLNRAHLQREGMEVPILAVSAELARLADRLGDPDLAEESGFAPLLEFLIQQVSGAARASLVARSRAELLAVVELLAMPFETERRVLSDPETSERVLAELAGAKERAAQLRSGAARWSTTLSDGMSDLTSDLQHDLRRRGRELLKTAEDTIENSDPSVIWHEFERWLYARNSEEIIANYILLRDRAAELSAQVAEHFAEMSRDSVATIEAYNPSIVLDDISTDISMEFEMRGVAAKGFGLLRGMQSGGYMVRSGIGMVFSTLNPMAVPIVVATAGVALVMGRKTMTDERRRELGQARSQAKQAVRQFLDEVNFLIGKDSQDTMRRLQRQLRDHYMARAEELQASTAEALSRAAKAAENSRAEREHRLKIVDAELGRIDEHRLRIANLGRQPRDPQ